MQLNETAIQTLADDWYQALDRHVPLAEVLEFLVDEGLEMRFPEGVSRGHAGFADWYAAVTGRFFDERHTLTKVTPHIDGDTATVEVLVNWQARMWTPPAPASEWLGFDADQTWIVVADPLDGGIKVRTYIVNELRPMPGSASL